MIEVEVAGRGLLQITHVVLDIDGTIALDGVLLPGMKERLALLDEYAEVHLLTADTYGTQAALDAELGLQTTVIQHGAVEKGGYVLALGAESVAVIGNGADDVAMFNAAALRIAVLGQEGLAATLLKSADILVRDVNDALDLLLNPLRLVATLRR